MKKSKKINRVKKQILNALSDREVIKIKICKANYPMRKETCYEAQIGDGKDMDMSDCKGSTGFTGFSLKEVLKEIEDEMLSLK